MSTFLLVAQSLTGASPQGYTPKVSVSGPTRLDWTFTATNRSLPKLPPGFLEDGYDSAKQSYELFVPPRKNPKQPLPAILFISAGAEPEGWKAYETVCKQLGFVFIGVRDAGNPVAIPKRCRVVLDCFDDVRRQVPLDPDRTYVSGLSGGGRVACAIGFALPEYFGGIIPWVAGGELRSEPYLRHRAIDRLSVALITGQTDFNRGEVEKWCGPYWKEIGIRSKVWVQPNLGHGAPSPATLLEAIKFLDEAKDQRAALAKQYPATRATSDGAATREEAAKALLDEGKQKLAVPAKSFAGLMVLKGVLERYPDLDTAQEAKKILLAQENKKDRAWEADDIAEQRKFLIVQARALSDYVLTGIPPKSRYEKNRPDMAKTAIGLWEQVIADAPASDRAGEGKKIIGELEKIGAKK